MPWTRTNRIAIVLLAIVAPRYQLKRWEARASSVSTESNHERLSNSNRKLAALRPQFLLRNKIVNIKFSPKPNLLFIVSDQLRFDAIRIMQDRLPLYDGYTKVETPNIDRLARMGVLFETAYCVSPSCAPSRTALKSGNSLQRSAIKGNRMIEKSVYRKMGWIERRILELETLEQMLVENQTYTAVTLGKWHVPLQLYHRRGDAKQRGAPVISVNDYSFKNDQFGFRLEQHFKPIYDKQLRYLVGRDGIHYELKRGQQVNPATNFPYTPIRIDPRYNVSSDSDAAEDDGTNNPWEEKQSRVAGLESLPANYTPTAVLGQMALRALDQLADSYERTQVPFSLQCHFGAPHPPKVALPEFAQYYLDRVDTLRLPPSIKDDLKNSAYAPKTKLKKEKPGTAHVSPFSDPSKVAELTALYFGIIEEMDVWIGQLLDRLEARPGIAKNTMIVFTSDHGDMMGAHGKVGKGILLEEAARVVLMMAFPGRIPANQVVSTPVSHMDVTSTILDYLGWGGLDRSDGTSLRRYIDKTSFNWLYDERTVVVEIDTQIPKNNHAFRGKFGTIPNLCLRKGNFKLMLPRSSRSDVLDMMYDLDTDPYESRNLLGENGRTAPDGVVGKAEHLKVLLVEWMQRMDGPHQVYSSNRWDLGRGKGAIREIELRRTWREVDLWVSDAVLSFGPPVFVGRGAEVEKEEEVVGGGGGEGHRGAYLRNEYLYMGRTTPGVVHITDIRVVGPNASLFAVDATNATLSRNRHIRVKVSLSSVEPVDYSQLQATLQIANNANDVHHVEIRGETDASSH